MERKIIHIDEDKCNGCGLCIPTCPEGAIQMIDGKARVIHESACDGLGACLGPCPEGAITIEEREADPYDEVAVIKQMLPLGAQTLQSHLNHLLEHEQMEFFDQAVSYLKEQGIPIPRLDQPVPQPQPQTHPAGECPGMMTLDRRRKASEQAAGPDVPSELRQWPIQLTLLNPHAPYFEKADLLIAADCVAFTYGNFHQRFLKDKIMVMFCPKLDQNIQSYIEKLTTIFRDNDIQSITVLRMEVPCCGGVVSIIEQALRQSEKNIIIKEYTISLTGEIV
ncbi:MAG: 4Fe-4S binding protein [Candidatus Omnitrophica bacterium]|nr:4Fe-4S binding protein [Candidatus Omnitrophota bacterium]